MSTLAFCWKKLLQNEDIEAKFEGIEAKDVDRLLQCGGKIGANVDAVENWLEIKDVMTEDDVPASDKS